MAPTSSSTTRLLRKSTRARTTPPVGGRWGEAASVPGVPFANPTAGGSPLNLVQSNYNNPVRAGYSLDISDIFTYVANGPSLTTPTAIPWSPPTRPTTITTRSTSGRLG